jgi:hypothetical protein
MATLTTWEADKGGYFQGAVTPGRAVDWALDKIGKLPKLPNIEPNKDHWRTWPDGKAMAVTDAWIEDMIRAGRLPSRQQVEYRGNHEDMAQARVMTGTHVFVEMLDTDRKTRHRCIMLGNVLIASKEGWEASLKKAS